MSQENRDDLRPHLLASVNEATELCYVNIILLTFEDKVRWLNFWKKTAFKSCSYYGFWLCFE